jgi:glucose/arabinose dehydrogenase
MLIPARPVAASGQIAEYKTGLNWPIALAFAPDGRIFYAERTNFSFADPTSDIRIIQDGVLLGTPYFRLTGTNFSGERGLLGLALDPDFPTMPYVYAYQTYDDPVSGTRYNRIVRISGSGNVGTFDRVILSLPPLTTAIYHNGGVIAFGPDKKLYALVGENETPALAQNPMSPMGKVLRMNRDGTVPSDNPFVGDANWNPYVYTYGHRNMFGLTFHPVTGRAYVTENGPACNDEVNLLIPGRNYGWGPAGVAATCPAPSTPDITVTNQDGPSPVLPIFYWTTTICPTGAAIYEGAFFPALHGDLFMGECNFYRFHLLHLNGPNYDSVASDTVLWTAPSIILDVRVGPDGAVWLTTPFAIYRYWDSGRPPVASFTASPVPAIVGATVTLDASASSDPDGTIVTYAWDFGDSSPLGSGKVTSHAYPVAGTYVARLTVTDNESFTAGASKLVTIQSPPPGPQPPVARFTVSPSPVDPQASVTFDATSSSATNATIVSYVWNFGDSSMGTGATTTHAYSRSGLFTVTLNVTDNQSLSSTAVHQVEVRNLSPKILSSTPGAGSVTVTVGTSQVFSVNATDTDGDALTYTWKVNGAVVGGNSSDFTFASATAGTYKLNVTVSDGTFVIGREWTVTVVVDPYVQVSGSIVLGILAAAYAGVVFLVWRTRRKRKPEPPPPPPP